MRAGDDFGLPFDPLAEAMLGEALGEMLTWPLGRRGRDVLVVLGERPARWVAHILRDSSGVDVDSTIVIGVRGIKTSGGAPGA